MYESFGLIGIQLPEKYKENIDLNFKAHIVHESKVNNPMSRKFNFLYILQQWPSMRSTHV
jgi:hypothetical protein